MQGAELVLFRCGLRHTRSRASAERRYEGDALTKRRFYLALGLALIVGAAPARGMTINDTFDSTIVNAPNAADIENTITTATNAISALYTNSGSVNIYFQYAPGSFLGESDSSYYTDTYSTIVSELNANASTHPNNTVLSTALANLSSGNDANGSRDILATAPLFRLALNDPTATPCFKSLGIFVSSCNQTYDGVVVLSSSQPIDFTRPVPAYNGSNLEYDGVQIVEHEVDEVLGGGGSGSVLGGSNQNNLYGILDLFRYAAPGTPSFTPAGNATSYFSIDGGTTDIVGFNQDSSGDYGDWASSTTCSGGGRGGINVQSAFACNNQQVDETLTSPEFTMLQALGYDPAQASPTNIAWNCSTNPDSQSYTGSLSATKTTACTQIVLGNSTFTGGTSIDAGTLQIGNNGATGSITGNVADNAILAFDRSDTVTFAGNISGSGAVAQTGSGTLILTGTNSYTGGTTITGGTLQIGNGGAGSLPGNVIDNSTLAIDISGSLTVNGVISGTGGLTTTGTGTVYLNAANTYTGNTTILSGVLVLGTGGTTGSVVGSVVDNGALYIDRSDNITLANGISGSGTLVQVGSGTTLVSSTKTYFGATIVDAGKLQLAAGAFLPSGSALIVNGGTFDFNGNSQTIPSLSGSGGAVTLGSATLTVNESGNPTYAGTISGTGSLVVSGSGTLTLTGNNTYAGGTTISAGTLQLGNGGTSGSVAGNIADNASLVFDTAGAMVVGGTISGTGSVSVMGTGVVLSAANTYSGGTTINSGSTLTLGNGGTTGSIAGVVTDSGSLYINHSNTFVFGNAMTGSGTLVQGGSGTTVLTANESYLGGTQVLAGTLQIGNGGSTGSVLGDIVDNATLVFNRSDVPTYAGTISGSGAVQVGGSGIMVFTGNSTYTGGTTITGVMQLGVGGTTGSIVGNIVDNKLLLINRSGTLTLAGQIAGSGAVQLIGSGTVILTGSNNYTGDTTISSGTLQLGDGVRSGSTTSNFTDNGTLTLNPGGGINVNNVISGSGSLMAMGGSSYLNNTNTYSGGTTIGASGILVLGEGGTTGSIVGNVTDNGAFYIIHSDTYTLAGTISGTGSLVQDGTGTTILTASNSNSGNTQVLAGTLQIGNGGTTGSVAGNIVDNSVLVFNRSDVPTYAGVISGTGSVQVGGSGIMVFTGNNTYTGGTTITGVMQLGVGGTSGAIVGNVVDNKLLLLNRSDTITLSGSISGSGAVQTIGSGTVVLAGANTYSGDTTIFSGTLQLGDGVASGSTISNFTDNGTLALDPGGGIFINNVVSGSGSLVAMGGSSYLNNTNTYTGGTTINAGGILVLGAGGTTGSITGNVVDNGALYIIRSNTYSFAGTISGSGSVVQDGSGTTVLAASNSYSGGTSILSGTVQAAVSASLGTGPVTLNGSTATLLLSNGVNIANSVNIDQAAFIDVNGSDSATITGSLIGSAQFTKNGTGTLTLDTDNRPTYSGNIFFHGNLVAGVTGAFGTGTVTDLGSVLTLDDGVIDANPTNLVDNLDFVQNRGTSVVTAAIGETGGPWGISKTGAGTLLVEANNTFTGETVVTAGTLGITGRIAGGATVQPGGTLTVSGTVGGNVVVQNGATLSSAGLRGVVGGASGTNTLTANGSIILSGNSTTQLGIASNGMSDRLSASDAIDLAGTLDVQTVGTYQPHYGDSFLIATAPTLSGQFAAVPDTFSGVLMPVLHEVPNGGVEDLVLQVGAGSYVSALSGATMDETTIAAALDGARAAHYSDLKPLYDALDPLPADTRETAFADLVPDTERSLPLVAEMQNSGFTTIVGNRLAALSEGGEGAGFTVDTQALALAATHATTPQTAGLLELGLNVGGGPFSSRLGAAQVTPAQSRASLGDGLSGFVSGSSLDGSVADGAGKAKAQGFIVAAGIEQTISNRFTFGASVAYADTTTTALAQPSSAQVSSMLGAVYGRYAFDGWFASGFGGAARETATTTRQVIAGSTAFGLHGHTGGTDGLAGLAVGTRVLWQGWTIDPSAGLQWLGAHTRGYSETGGAAAMRFAGVTRDSLTGRVGFDASGGFDLGDGTTLHPIAHAYYVHDFEAGAGVIAASFAEAPAVPLDFAMPSRGRDWADLGLGLNADLARDLTIGVHYDATAGRSDLFYGAWTAHLDLRF
jgi:autotransporter-associated beta strand protein